MVWETHQVRECLLSIQLMNTCVGIQHGRRRTAEYPCNHQGSLAVHVDDAHDACHVDFASRIPLTLVMAWVPCCCFTPCIFVTCTW